MDIQNFKYKINFRLRFLGLCLALVGAIACTAADPPVSEPTEPAIAATASLPPIATQLPEPTQTLLPVYVSEPATPTAISIDVPSDVPSEPTLTPFEVAIEPDTAPIETAEETVEPTAEPAPAIAPAIEGGCRPLEQTVQYTNPFIVTDNLPPHSPLATEVNSGFTNGVKMIHLGFDVEASAEVLGPLLDVLDRRQVKTTMFILGSWTEIYPDWVKEMGSRGHEFANHTWSHSNMADMDAETVKQELASTEALVQSLTGKSTKPFLRPPFGSRSDVSIQAAYEAGYSTIIWSGSTEDWREGANVETMCKTLLDGSYPGSILYSHTWHPEMPETIDRFIGELQAQGYTFVPMSVIMSGRPQDYLIPNN
ncbi:MAG: peptidoglycan/xylan/chitin deacetylase (PgdA/CDA1 family) [Cellvibrionaceae bacterium]|jgi:peptidoglycan/xylan/chitin deacetylase (PgdA/CDA1 family)